MAEKKIIELEIESNLGSLKEQLLSAKQFVQELADKFGASSQEVANAADNVRALEKEIKQTNKTLKSIGLEGKFQAITGSITGVLNGFQAVQGSLGLIGIESKGVEDALLKVQSAMALADGVEGLFKAQTSFKKLKDITVVGFQGMTAAGKTFAVTGIGLVIAGLGLAIANWDKLKAAMTSQTEEQLVANETMSKATDSIKNELSAADKLSIQLKDENLTRAEKIKKVKQFQDAYPNLLKNVNLETQSIAQINGQLTKNIKLLQLQAQAKAIEEVRAEKLQAKVKKQLDFVSEAQENATTWTINYGDAAENGWLGFSSAAENAKLAQTDFSKVQTKGTKNLDQQIKSLDKSSDSIDKQIKALQKQGASIGDNSEKIVDYSKQSSKNTDTVDKETKAIEAQNLMLKANADAKRNAIEKQNEINQRFEDIAEQNYQRNLSDQEKELLAVQDKYFELETLATGNADALNEIEISKLNDINDINLKYQDLDSKQKEDKRLKDKEAQDKADADRIEAEKAVAETLKQVRNEDFNNIQAGINLVANLFEGNKKVQAAALVAQNAVAIAKTIIETKASNQAARASGTALSIATGGASVAAAEALILRNNIGAGISIGAIVAATGKGLSALKAGGSPSGGGNLSDSGVGAGAVMSANFNVVGNSGFNQLAQLQQAPAKAYVVSGDVSTAQALDRNRIENATLVH